MFFYVPKVAPIGIPITKSAWLIGLTKLGNKGQDNTYIILPRGISALAWLAQFAACRIKNLNLPGSN